MDIATHHILVIDDDRTTRETVAQVLAEEGYKVATAKDGREGIDQLPSFRPHLVITDLQMPELDGLGVLAQVRATGTPLPVVIVTALQGDEVRAEALRLGAADYLSKPLDLDELLECVARNLRARV